MDRLTRFLTQWHDRRGHGHQANRFRQHEFVQDEEAGLLAHRPALFLAPGLSRRALLSGLGGLGLLLAHAPMLPAAAAQGTQLGQCGGNPGLEALLAYSQGTIIPDTLLAADPRWPFYMNPNSPTISFRYPPGWQPMDLPPANPGVVLYSPRQDALVAMGSAQAQIYVPMDQLLDLAMQAVFTQYLRQPVGQQLCVYPLSRSAGSEVDFAAAQNRTTLAALSVTAVYSEGVTLDPNSNLVPTTNTIAIFYAVAAPSDQFAALTETVFFPIFGQLLMGGGTSDEDEDEDEDESDDDWDDEG
jgi:hypothetical protein